METKLVIDESYQFLSGRIGIFKKADGGIAYFLPNKTDGYKLENGLVGFPLSFAEKDFKLIESLHETQKKQILDYLKTGKSITKLEALKMFSCWNSGDCIFNLRKEGYNIETTMITNGKKRFASYKLIENGKEN